MNVINANPSRIAQGIAIVLVLILCLPLFVIGAKTIRAYTELHDVRFQVEKLLSQQQILSQDLRIHQENMSALHTNLKPLSGSTSQASAELQTHLRTLIVSAGGNVETSSQVNIQSDNMADTTVPFRPISASVRWSVNEDGLAQFLAKSSAQGQNLKIDSLLIRRRQGTASLLDIRMQCSALWQDPSLAELEARP